MKKKNYILATLIIIPTFLWCGYWFGVATYVKKWEDQRIAELPVRPQGQLNTITGFPFDYDQKAENIFIPLSNEITISIPLITADSSPFNIQKLQLSLPNGAKVSLPRNEVITIETGNASTVHLLKPDAAWHGTLVNLTYKNDLDILATIDLAEITYDPNEKTNAVFKLYTTQPKLFRSLDRLAAAGLIRKEHLPKIKFLSSGFTDDAGVTRIELKLIGDGLFLGPIRLIKF